MEEKETIPDIEEEYTPYEGVPQQRLYPPPASGGGSNILRNSAFGCVILFFALLSAAVIIFMIGLNKTQESVVEPISDLVKQLVVPVTPVILPNPSTIVREINDLARLETASYEYEKVITAENNTDLFWGALGESMVFVANGRVYAGLDFADMAVTDLQVYDPVTVYVHLPEIQIFEDIPILDNEKSFVADRDTGIFTRADPELETQVRQEAEKAILASAYESEILERATFNAQQYMLNFLGGLGFENIIFTDEPPLPAPPYEQSVPKGFVLTPAP